jgi:hypothetical protein
MTNRLHFTIALWLIALSGSSFGQQAIVNTPTQEGQGYVFGDGSQCWLLIPNHVILPDDGTGNPAATTVTISDRGPVFISEQAVRQDKDLDLAVATLKSCPPASGGAEALAVDPDSLVHRKGSGTLNEIPIDFDNQSNGLIVITPRPVGTDRCPLRSALSGSLVMRGGKIAGMLQRVTDGDCPKGFVRPLADLQNFVAKQDLVLSLDPRAPELLAAASKGDETAFNILLAGLDDPNVTDATGVTALVRLAYSGDNFLAFLRAKGLLDANYHYPDNSCQLWLDTRLRMASTLLKKGASIDGASGPGWTPMMQAVIANDRCDNTPFVKFLLQHGANADNVHVENFDSGPSTSTPLMMAVDDGRPNTVSALLAAPIPANPNLTSDSWSGRDLQPIFALALSDYPDENSGPLGRFSDPHLDKACRDADSGRVAKFRLLLPVSDLTRKLAAANEPHDSGFVGHTIQEVLAMRLGGGCTFSDCNGAERDPKGACLERMLGALTEFEKKH